MKALKRLLLAVLLLPGCDMQTEAEKTASRLTGGSPSRGKEAIRSYGCVTCHTIPGIPEAGAVVGPPLDRIGSRMYLAGVLLNTPENLMRWIRNPPEVHPKTAMPNLHVRPDDLKDIAGYLYTLK